MEKMSIRRFTEMLSERGLKLFEEIVVLRLIDESVLLIHKNAVGLDAPTTKQHKAPMVLPLGVDTMDIFIRPEGVGIVTTGQVKVWDISPLLVAMWEVRRHQKTHFNHRCAANYQRKIVIYTMWQRGDIDEKVIGLKGFLKPERWISPRGELVIVDLQDGIFSQKTISVGDVPNSRKLS